MRRHSSIIKIQEPYYLFLWSFLWWRKCISSKPPAWFLHDCIFPSKAYAGNQSFPPFESPKEPATSSAVFGHLWPTTFFQYITRLKFSHPGEAGKGRLSWEAADVLESHQPCRSQQWPGSRSMAHPSWNGIIPLYPTLVRAWPDTLPGFGLLSAQDVDKLGWVQ